jgi:hypothetical protein
MLSELAQRYQKAEELVMARYASEKDRLGRSQFWKISAIAEDRRKERNTGLMDEFLKDVEQMVNLQVASVPIVESLCKTACASSSSGVKPKNEGIEVKDVQPHENGA